MGQFMKVLTSAGVALGLSFLFYDQRDLGEYGGGFGERREAYDLTRPGWQAEMAKREVQRKGLPLYQEQYGDVDPN